MVNHQTEACVIRFRLKCTDVDRRLTKLRSQGIRIFNAGEFFAKRRITLIAELVIATSMGQMAFKQGVPGCGNNSHIKDVTGGLYYKIIKPKRTLSKGKIQTSKSI